MMFKSVNIRFLFIALFLTVSHHHFYMTMSKCAVESACMKPMKKEYGEVGGRVVPLGNTSRLGPSL